MILEVLKDESEVLRRISVPTLINNETRDLVLNMKETMVSAKGIGLAAPQVGVNLRVIVVQMMDGTIQEMINPKIKGTSANKLPFEEGCLSVPDHYVEVDRYIMIRVKFQNIHGKYKQWTLKGLESIIVQHEIDHLDGVLMTDYE
jgi:peptide deformylase